MKSEWKTIRADEFCSLVTDGTHDSPKPQAAGRKLITSKHLKGYYLDFESANWISSEDYEKVIARTVGYFVQHDRNNRKCLFGKKSGC